MESKYFILFAMMLGWTWAQSEPSISDALEKLPPELQGKVNASDIESIKNKSQALFKEKCEKNGGSEAYAAAQSAYERFPKCVKESLGLEDPSVLQKEIEDAKPNGTVDEVFKKYCNKAPEAKKCFRKMSDAAKPCFSVEEQKNLKTVYNITEQLAEFICYKDGDRIALFIAEGGPQCFQDKQEQIQACVNETLGTDYQIDTSNLTASATALPQIAFGLALGAQDKECQQMSELQACVVGALEKCNAPTSANIVESLFKFVRKAMPCKSFGVVEAKPRSQVEEPKPSSASGLAVHTSAIILALAVALY